MLTLSRENLKDIKQTETAVSGEELFALPEKVLQFGTGVLLRGLPDSLIDRANRNRIFNGRIVVVKSTTAGSFDDFAAQDNLYTLHVKGIDQGKEIEEDVICSAISRVISATKDWHEVLKMANNPELAVVISNTTEAGIALVKESILGRVPESFPGKLLAVLYERFNALGGSEDSGLVIIPTELIVNNGAVLKAIVLELAQSNKLETAFIDWLDQCNFFCNSLVDRIVPGKPPVRKLKELEERSGYRDALRITAEPYYLWAIEGNEHIRDKLSFARCNKGVIIFENIEPYRELKLRLLNGTHTLSCAVAILSGFATVKQAMEDSEFYQFVSYLMRVEIAPAIPYQIDQAQTEAFICQVLDRFRNPSIEHLWQSISVQYTLKLKMRVVPLLLTHYKRYDTAPKYFAFGFAAFIRFMKVYQQQGRYFGQVGDQDFEINDDQAAVFFNAWQKANYKAVVHTILADKELWNTDLTYLPGFEREVCLRIEQLITRGATEALIHLK